MMRSQIAHLYLIQIGEITKNKRMKKTYNGEDTNFECEPNQ